jgi:hypothetical protein
MKLGGFELDVEGRPGLADVPGLAGTVAVTIRAGGWLSKTVEATPAEARAFAQQLVDAADKAEG